MKYTLVFIFIIYTTFAMGQKSSKSIGYIVNIKNDTIYGTIKKPKDVSVHKKAIFTKNGITTIYSPDQLVAFCYKDRLFRSKDIMKPMQVYGKHFLEVIEEGKIKLYIFIYSSSFQTGNMLPIVQTNVKTDTYIERNKKFTRINKIEFKKTFKNIFFDYPRYVDKVENGDFKHSDLQMIVKIINQK